MTITLKLTAISKDQWKNIGFVALWLVSSIACAVLLAYVEHNIDFLAATPLFNLLGVTLRQFTLDEESKAISNLSPDIQPEVQQVVDTISAKADDEISKVIGDSPITPTIPTNIPVITQ